MQTESGVRIDCTKTESEKRVRGAAAGRQVTPHADLRKIQALPYQILHEMKPIIHESIRGPSPDIPVRAYQMECIRIGWRPAGHQVTPHSANPYRDSANRPVTPGLHTAPIRRFPHLHVSV